MPFDMNIPKNPNASKLDALKAAREKAASASQPRPDAITKWISPGDCKERLRFIFDDSGSMGSGKDSKMEQAREGSIECLRSCIPNQTSVAIHLLGKEQDLENLNSNLIEVAEKLQKLYLTGGGTPLFTRTMAALALSPKPTRLVMFTDGSPTDSIVQYDREAKEDFFNQRNCDEVIKRTKELGSIPIDTVFFGPVSDYTESERKLLKYLADKTGGYFMVFDPAKVNFRTAFKYLAPVNRLMLASESVRKEIESGRRA